jgi:glycosyltransferase involved in cell wall biosynthesis
MNVMDRTTIRIAAFGFRSIPPSEGSAGSDKIAMELYPRLVQRGCHVIGYNRIYKGIRGELREYNGVQLKYFKTLSWNGFDSFFHSCLATFHIILFNSADVVHIHNGGNSIWALFLRLFGKRVYVSQDGVDWKREKWAWYAKIYLYFSSFITAFIPNGIIFDNLHAKDLFERKFRRKYYFIPYGSEVSDVPFNITIFNRYNIQPFEYFLFVGRFIPDKGIHYLVKAFETITTTKKLVLVGGAPNPSQYEKDIHHTSDGRIVFPGFVYGDDALLLMKNAYAYIQPSDVEGLSPVILTIMALQTPLICSDIPENLFVVENNAIIFKKGNIEDLKNKLLFTLNNYHEVKSLAEQSSVYITRRFSWDKVTNEYLNIFSRS